MVWWRAGVIKNGKGPLTRENNLENCVIVIRTLRGWRTRLTFITFGAFIRIKRINFHKAL